MNFKDLFSKENRVMALLTIVYILFGLMFCILPNTMKETFEVIVCVALLFYGTIILVANCISSIVSSNKILMITSILAVIIGVFLLFVRSFFVLIMALCILALAAIKTMILRKSKFDKNANWYVWLAIAIIHYLVAILAIIFFALNDFLIVSMILIGASLIFEAVGNIFAFLKNQKDNAYREDVDKNNENSVDETSGESVENLAKETMSDGGEGLVDEVANNAD